MYPAVPASNLLNVPAGGPQCMQSLHHFPNDIQPRPFTPPTVLFRTLVLGKMQRRSLMHAPSRGESRSTSERLRHGALGTWGLPTDPDWTEFFASHYSCRRISSIIIQPCISCLQKAAVDISCSYKALPTLSVSRSSFPGICYGNCATSCRCNSSLLSSYSSGQLAVVLFLFLFFFFFFFSWFNVSTSACMRSLISLMLDEARVRDEGWYMKSCYTTRYILEERQPCLCPL